MWIIEGIDQLNANDRKFIYSVAPFPVLKKKDSCVIYHKQDDVIDMFMVCSALYFCNYITYFYYPEGHQSKTMFFEQLNSLLGQNYIIAISGPHKKLINDKYWISDHNVISMIMVAVQPRGIPDLNYEIRYTPQYHPQDPTEHIELRLWKDYELNIKYMTLYGSYNILLQPYSSSNCERKSYAKSDLPVVSFLLQLDDWPWRGTFISYTKLLNDYSIDSRDIWNWVPTDYEINLFKNHPVLHHNLIQLINSGLKIYGIQIEDNNRASDRSFKTNIHLFKYLEHQQHIDMIIKFLLYIRYFDVASEIWHVINVYRKKIDSRAMKLWETTCKDICQPVPDINILGLLLQK
jgi:hypothetical protein